MNLYYGKDGLISRINFAKNPKMNGFVRVIKFDPVDLFIDLIDESDPESYLVKFLDNLGEEKNQAISEIKIALESWKDYKPKFIDEINAKNGAEICSKIMDKLKL